MFFFTAHITKKKLILALLILLLLTALFVLPRFLSASASGSISGETEADRINYLNSMGWQVAEKSGREQTVLIPKTFSQVYENYNKLQLECGFDLKQFCGLEVTRYTYTVTNYPNVSDEVYADLLVYQGRIIGGDIHSLNLDGFMQNLSGGSKQFT